jgi:uncharacterized coiled-coil protein SlyX
VSGAGKRSTRDRDHAQACARTRYLDEVRERLARQEQVIAHLAASGRSTALAEKRLMVRRQALDALLQRHERRSAGQGSTSSNTPAQLGPADRDGRPGSEVS